MFTVYNMFREFNKHNKADGYKAHVVSVNYAKNLCIVKRNKDGEFLLLPIEILISDMNNNLVHINDFSKLKNWQGFQNEETVKRMRCGIYPQDYFESVDKYIINVTDDMENLVSAKRIYEKGYILK